MFIFIMSHLVKYDSVCPLLFENYKKWLECNMITLGALAENILTESFHGYACAVYPLHVLPIFYSFRENDFCDIQDAVMIVRQ